MTTQAPLHQARTVAIPGPGDRAGDPGTLAAFVREKWHTVFIERTILGVHIVLIAAALLLANALVFGTPTGRFEPLVYVSVVGVQGVLLAFLRLRPPAQVRGITLIVVAVMCAFVTWWALSEGRGAEANALIVGYVMACAAMLPWGPVYQFRAALAGSIGVILCTTGGTLELPPGGTPTSLLIPLALLFASVYTAVQLDRGRLENGRDELARLQAEAALRSLNAELESRVRVRTLELEDVVAELRSFSYSVSHDLRSPLRSINGFSQQLEEEFGEVLGREGGGHLARVRAASVRMGEMIDALLALSRVSRTDLLFTDVDLSELGRSVAAELEAADPERKIEWTIQPGLRARGDEVLLRLVLQNLLSNGRKFTARTSSPRVVLREGSFPDGERCFVVEDNGAGFDSSHAGQLFQLFRRLHAEGTFEGTGVGLATVRRIVERHGGRVWAEGEPGKGARFFFSVG